jgi:predicted DNA-binding transcriptional regulator AlpA
MRPRAELRSTLLSPKQLAERLGVSLSWVYQNADSLPFTRRINDRLLKFEEREVEAWIASKVPPPPETPLVLVPRNQ